MGAGTAEAKSLTAETPDLGFQVLEDAFPAAFPAQAAVLYAAEGCRGGSGAEGFLAVNQHLGRDIGQHRRGLEMAPAQIARRQAFAATKKLSRLRPSPHR